MDSSPAITAHEKLVRVAGARAGASCLENDKRRPVARPCHRCMRHPPIADHGRHQRATTGRRKGAFVRLLRPEAVQRWRSRRGRPITCVRARASQPGGVAACVDSLALKDLPLAWDNLREMSPGLLMHQLRQKHMFKAQLDDACTITLFVTSLDEASDAVATGDAAKTVALLAAAHGSGRAAEFAGLRSLHQVAAPLGITADDALCIHVPTPAATRGAC